MLSDMQNIANFISDIRQILHKYRCEAYMSLNSIIIHERWDIGRRIVQEEQNGELRANYGSGLLDFLSTKLTEELGKGFSARNLAYCRKLFIYFNDWEILHTRVQNLSWSHLRAILGEKNSEARLWYIQEASKLMWSVKTLTRNIESQYYYRLLSSHNKKCVEDEMQMLTSDKEYAPIPAELYIKSPVITEFLGLPQWHDYTESDLESALISHLQQFLMELGKGYAFVERQQRIVTDAGDFYIDLVFYNYLLKCFILIDLKTTKITHQDVGQMDMYLRMYDELKRTEGDNPTLGIILCAETSEDIARYSILNGNPQLFASKYLTFLPSEDELRNEIEYQKYLYHLQKGINK